MRSTTVRQMPTSLDNLMLFADLQRLCEQAKDMKKYFKNPGSSARYNALLNNASQLRRLYNQLQLAFTKEPEYCGAVLSIILRKSELTDESLNEYLGLMRQEEDKPSGSCCSLLFKSRYKCNQETLHEFGDDVRKLIVEFLELDLKMVQEIETIIVTQKIQRSFQYKLPEIFQSTHAPQSNADTSCDFTEVKGIEVHIPGQV